MNPSFLSVLKELDPRTKLLGLVVLLSEALFVAALARLPEGQVIWGLLMCVVVLLATVVALVRIERKTEATAAARRNQSSAAAQNVEILPDRREFYTRIAPYYDQRNTSSLLETHRAVITEVSEMLDDRGSLDVLDLGGGTGRLIAAQFFRERRLRWTYIDQSPGMLEQFMRNLETTALRSEIILGDLNNLDQLVTGQFDIVLLSLVLTSLPDFPDFTRMATHIRPGGRLIVADIDPAYSAAHPVFAVGTDNLAVGLEVIPRHPLDVIDRITRAGLKTINTHSIFRSDGVRYSYLVVAEKGADEDALLCGHAPEAVAK